MRPLRLNDYPVWLSAHISANPKVNEFDQEKKSKSELTKSEYKKLLRKNEQFRKDKVIYYFGIFEKKTGRLMGYVMFALILRFNVQSGRIAYSLFNNYWKRGYGKEVVDAALGFGFSKLKLHRLEAEIKPNNRASVSLVKSLGFQSEGIRRGAVYYNNKWHDNLVYAILAEDRGMKNTKPTILR